ncbi:dystroglycan 1-like [Amphiura filiformis]|uniref:dystroglycan 1-like n=1 Tax=Amphiura filiformis TaxID=82378 RepID=UPI003B21B6B5
MASLVCRHLSSYRNIAVNVLAITTVLLTMLSWTMCYVEANEPADVRAWFELHSIPEDDLRQHNKDTASSSSSTRTNTKHSIWKPVSQGDGIGDTIATVGRVFKYAIPKDAFRGDISRYQITEAGKEQLPSWLFYTGETQTLEGIPSESDMDQYYITIIAFGKETNGTVSQATDVFSVNVVPDLTGQSGATAATPVQIGPVRGVKCSNDEPGVTATIVLDADWGKLGAKNRMESISKMSQNSRLGVEQFRLLPIGSKSLLGESVLVAGPGNVKRPEHPGVALSWQIGCGTDAGKFPVVTILELSSKDGSMATKLGHNIIGWHVTNGQSKVKRVRRQANLMGTPVPTPLPTDMPPRPTATLVVPSTRVVPTQMSPSVMPPKMTQSMIVTIAPTRSFGPIEETTMMPTSGMIKPTPQPPMKNTRPKQNVPLTRVDATALKVFSFQIPKHTFIDAEEGNTRKLRLVLMTPDGAELPSNSWVQFNKQTQTMEGLPLKKDVGRQEYLLVAQDKMGLTTRLVFELVVNAAPKLSENPPPVTMGMVLDIDFNEFVTNPAVKAEILNKIASVFGDPDASAITFTDIQEGSVILSWTNNTLPTDGCNKELIDSIMSKLVGPDGEPTQELIDAFHPLKVSSVNAIATGACASTTNQVPYKDTTPIMTTAGAPGSGKSSSKSIVTTVIVPILIVSLIIIVIVCVIVIIHCRRSRKHKLAQEDQKTFSNKGIPIIFAEEREDGEKPPTSSSPLIMREEKPPISPPDYASPNKNNSRSKNSGRQNVPMVEISGSSPYKRPPPLATSTPESRNQRPGKKPAYRAPPAYVPP